jgi:antitoxin HicB
MNKYSGSNFDDFLEEEGILEEVSAKAHKRLLSLQLMDIMNESNINKTELAKRLQTSNLQLENILDPNNINITLASLEKIACAVGKKLKIEFS